MKQKSLYAILDKSLLQDKDLLVVANSMLEKGAGFIQYRNKTGSPEEQERDAQLLSDFLQKTACQFILNDDPLLAKRVNAAGVHLGQEDMPLAEARKILGQDKTIGISTHNVEEALRAESEGADYIAVGDLFGSKTKQNTISTSLETLQTICQKVSIPVVGIGGITPENAPQVFAAGATAVALSRALSGDWRSQFTK